jgi:potassium-dependent mechanosensitive channel
VALMRAIALAVLALLALAGHARAYDEIAITAAETEARTIQAELRKLTALPRPPYTSDQQIDAERAALEDLQTRALSQSDTIDTPLIEVGLQLDQLGAAPTDGTTEAPSITQQRNQLISQLARLNAVQKLYGLIAIEAQQGLTRLTAAQRERFFQRIFEPGLSIADPRLWVDTMKGSGQFVSRVQNLATSGMRRVQGRVTWYPALIFPAGLLLIWIVGGRLLPALARRVGYVAMQTGEVAAEGKLLRLWRVVWGTARLFLAVFLGLLFLLVALETMGLLPPEFEALFNGLSAAIGTTAIYGGFAFLICAPFRPERRLIAVDDQAARSIPLLVTLSTFIFTLGEQASDLASSLNLPVSFSVGQSAFTSFALVILTALIFLVLRRQATKNLAGENQAFFLVWFLKLMPLLWIALVVAALALISGYVALSYFIVGNLMKTGLLLVALGVLQAFVDQLSSAMVDTTSRVGQFFRRVTSLSEQGTSRIVLLFRTVMDAVLVIGGLIVLLLIWTVVLFNISDVYSLIGRGLQIGNISLSFGTLLLALGVLAVGIIFTRIMTRWLNRRVLPQTQLDRGVQNSLQSAASYSGYIIAAALALSAAGLEFSNLAIVAGALGVGIGFGLQSIVNNFVSGLILLAERPVRVGDWIVTQTGEGIVKKINVRATEIDTFDNGTIIVPNSNLITNAVKNWTLRDSTGRFAVNVAMAHGVNPDEIIEKLEELARAHSKVMRHPPAEASLTKIMPNALEFEVGGQVRDALDSGKVASDIRRDIVKAFDKKLLMVPPRPPEQK